MQYKSYATKKDTKSRLARKQARRGVFVFNKKAAKLRRKARRLARHSQEQSE